MGVGRTDVLAKIYIEEIVNLLSGLENVDKDLVDKWERKVRSMGGYVSGKILGNIISDFENELENSDFFFRLGEKLILEMHGYLGYAARSSSTLREAIMMNVLYLNTQLSFVRTRLIENTDRASINFMVSGVAARHPQFFMECILSSFNAMLFQLAEESLKGLISFTYQKPENYYLYEKYFPCEMKFGCLSNELTFPAEYLDLKLQSSDQNLKALAESSCQNMAVYLPVENSISDLVREKVLSNLCEVDSLPQVAKKLNMSESTLKRKLRDEGLTYRALIDDIRKREAKALLLNSCMNLTQISTYLGYSDLPAFIKAFKRWTGVAPSYYRCDGIRTPE